MPIVIALAFAAFALIVATGWFRALRRDPALFRWSTRDIVVASALAVAVGILFVAWSWAYQPLSLVPEMCQVSLPPVSSYAAREGVLDCSVHATPVASQAGELTEVASFDTYAASDAVSFNGAWSPYPFLESGTILVNDRQYGLFVLRIKPDDFLMGDMDGDGDFDNFDIQPFELALIERPE